MVLPKPCYQYCPVPTNPRNQVRIKMAIILTISMFMFTGKIYEYTLFEVSDNFNPIQKGFSCKVDILQSLQPQVEQYWEFELLAGWLPG